MMTKSFQVLVFVFVILCSKIGETSVVPQDNVNNFQGLYTSNDKLVVLTKSNFNSQLTKKSHAWLIEFYNSWCGFCKRFAPVWKEFAADVANWKDVVTIGAIDCATDENNDICRNYEVMAYPTLIYFHENFTEGPENLGEEIEKDITPEGIKHTLLNTLVRKQLAGHGKNWPMLIQRNYTSVNEIWFNTPKSSTYVFLIFENDNSTLGTEVILDLHLIYRVSAQKVSHSSQLAKALHINTFPSVLAVDTTLKTVTIDIGDKLRQTVRKSIVDFLHKQKFQIQEHTDTQKELKLIEPSKSSYFNNKIIETGDAAYQTDLETGLRYILHNEISRKKYMTGEELDTLKNFLHVLIKYFPFTANGKDFVTELRRHILFTKELSGKKFADSIDELENTYAPVYSTLPEWYGCKGSAPNYRGFTCSLWTIFHVLTVIAAEKNTTDASEVLRVMHGYVKHFFGCTDCSEHFQAMAQKNNLFSVAENDGAIIWLWAAHNEVNHRLAGDITEDPVYPKKQFPTIENCPKCWQDKGAWNMTEILRYMKKIYGSKNINLIGVVPHPTSSPFSKFDITIFVLLHVYFAVMLLLVLRMILIKKIYKRKSYKGDALRKV